MAGSSDTPDAYILLHPRGNVHSLHTTFQVNVIQNLLHGHLNLVVLFEQQSTLFPASLALEAAGRIGVTSNVLALLRVRTQRSLESDTVRLGVVDVSCPDDHVRRLLLLDPGHQRQDHVVLLVKATTGGVTSDTLSGTAKVERGIAL